MQFTNRYSVPTSEDYEPGSNGLLLLETTDCIFASLDTSSDLFTLSNFVSVIPGAYHTIINKMVNFQRKAKWFLSMYPAYW